MRPAVSCGRSCWKPLLACEGARDDPAGRGSPARTLRCTAPTRHSRRTGATRSGSPRAAELGGRFRERRCPRFFARSHVLINNMRAGAPRQRSSEAAASCLPVLASNPVFDDLLPPGLLFDRDDPEIAERLRTLDRRRRPELQSPSRATTRRALGRRPPRYRWHGMKRDTILHLRRSRESRARRRTCSRSCRASGAGWNVHADAARERARGVGLRRGLAPAACRSTRSRCARTSTRSHSSGSSRIWLASGPRSSTRTSSMPTRTACSQAPQRGCRCASRRSTASTSSVRRPTSVLPTVRSRALHTCTSRSHVGSPTTSRTSRASTTRASRSFTTGSIPTGSRRHTQAACRGCSA